MLTIAKQGGMRIIGPNCLGFANIHSGVYAAFGSITREPKLKPGSVSLVTQSGGFGYSIALGCAEAGIGFRHVIATGNESDIDTVQLIDALLADRETGPSSRTSRARVRPRFARRRAPGALQPASPYSSGKAA